MFYIYSEYVDSDRQEYICVRDTKKEASKKVASLIKHDAEMHMDGEYYYFIKEH